MLYLNWKIDFRVVFRWNVYMRYADIDLESNFPPSTSARNRSWQKACQNLQKQKSIFLHHANHISQLWHSVIYIFEVMPVFMFWFIIFSRYQDKTGHKYSLVAL